MKMLFCVFFFLCIIPNHLFSMLQPYAAVTYSTNSNNVSSPLLDGHEETLPTNFLNTFAQILEENPKQFLDRSLPLPQGTVRDYLNYQWFKDTRDRKSVEEHNDSINISIINALLDNDELCACFVAQVIKKSHHNRDTREIKEFFENKILEKIRNEESALRWHRFDAITPLCLGLNCGIVTGLGIKLLKAQEHAFGYGTLGVGLLGIIITVPMIAKSGATIFFGNKRIKKYSQWLKMLKSNEEPTTTFYYISNAPDEKTY